MIKEYLREIDELISSTPDVMEVKVIRRSITIFGITVASNASV